MRCVPAVILVAVTILLPNFHGLSAAEFTVSGTVVDASGAPVSDSGNVTVQVLGDGVDPKAVGKIGADGKYSVTVKSNDPDPVIIVSAFRTSGERGTKPVKPGSGVEVKLDPLPKPRVKDGGGGRVDPDLGPPPPTVPFSLGGFPITYSKTIELTDAVSVDLQLLDFHGTINFSPTDDSNIFQARFTEFDFEYIPFNLPGTHFTDVNREVLADTQPFLGLFDISDGKLFLPFQTEWLDTRGNLVATSTEFFGVDVTPVSQTEVDIFLVSSGTFVVKRVPDSSPGTILFIAVVMLLISLARKQTNPL